MRKLLATSDSFALTVVRVALGVVMFAHGAQSMLGWFGGRGFSAALHGFEQQGIPVLFGLLAIFALFFGSLGLVAGFLGRIAALGIAGVMAVAIVKVHLANGFFMNFSGTKHGEGYEYHILAIAMALAIVLGGSGLWSIDRAIAKA